MSDDKESKQTLPEQEEKILEFWELNKIFEKSVERRKGAKRFVFYDGPPFATGLPHYGHILASTIKDVVPRYWAMKGYLVERRWGWDCHGLPIENIVENELKISGRKSIENFGVQKFNETARSRVLTYVQDWKKTVRRIGRFVDFDNSYKTMDLEYMESVWWAFAELYKKGLVYKDARTSLFCTRCETPLSNFEIAMDNSYRDQEDESVYVKLKLKNKGNEYLLIWTTTPWTLPGNAAVAVNPEIEYTKFKIGEEYFWSAVEPLHDLPESVAVKEKVKGSKLIGLEYEPLFSISESNGAYRIVGADFVDASEGTGLVHIAPAFGEEDFNLSKRENLPVLQMLDNTGRFADKNPLLDFVFGKDTFEANSLVIERLRQTDNLWKTKKIVHRYPICWRCSTPLIYKVQSAWFIKVAALKKKMLALNEKIDWHPDHLKRGRFGNGLETAPDWNVSRSRFWGTPVPIWECADCKKVKVLGSREDINKEATGLVRNRYILMRHGESESNIKDVTAGNAIDIFPLTLAGRIMAEKRARTLRGQKVDLIVSSPLLRTRETAEIVAKELGVKNVATDDGLREINFGLLEGKPIVEYLKHTKSLEDRFEQSLPGGENWNNVRVRVLKVLENLESKYKDKNILIVSHDCPLRLLWSAAAGLSNREISSFKSELQNEDFINPADIKELVYKKVPRNDHGEADLHLPYADKVEVGCDCGGKMKRIPDVFDCWFESGSMPFAEKHYPFENKKIFENNFPADFISEYIAQTRGWFYTLHVLSTGLFAKPSFKHVVTTGTIMSEKGEKLSKSKKNFPDPWSLFGKYGTDAIRFYLMSSPVMLADNINFSEKDVDEIYKKYCLIAYNVLGFYKLYEFRSGDRENNFLNSKNILDRWILSRLNRTVKKVTENFESYEVTHAVRPLLDFVQDVSLWYVRRSRDRVKENSDDAVFALDTLRQVLRSFALLTAPITPFLAEIIYRKIGGEKESVHLEDWPTVNKKLIDEKLETDMEEIRKTVSETLRLRAEAGIKIRQPLKNLQIANTKIKTGPELLRLIKYEVNVEEISFGSELKLDTAITPELKEKGLVREFVRNVQEMRKDAGLKPADVVRCQIAGDAGLEDILSRHASGVRKDINAEDLSVGGKKVFKAEKEITLDGKPLWVGIN